jgi:hypothetical protein
VGEADAAVELGEDGEAFLEAGHADEQQPETASVKAVAEVFEGGWGEPVGFVDDDELDVLDAAARIAEPVPRARPRYDALIDQQLHRAARDRALVPHASRLARHVSSAECEAAAQSQVENRDVVYQRLLTRLSDHG